MSENQEIKVFHIENDFIFYMRPLGKDIKCILHNIKLPAAPGLDCRAEEVGEAEITIGGSQDYNRYKFTIWGNGEQEEEYKHDLCNCYICMPTMLEKSDLDELEMIEFFDLILGLLNLEELEKELGI